MATPPFLDRATPPERQELLLSLGSGRDRWLRLETWIRETYGVEGEPLYAGGGTGWTLRFRRGGRALLTLMPRAGAFRALVVIGPSAWAAAAGATQALSPTTRDAWEGARPYPDGRWLWLDVADDRVVADIECLVALKSPPPRDPRRGRVAAA